MGKKDAEQLLYGTMIVSWLLLAAYGLLLLAVVVGGVVYRLANRRPVACATHLG
jgi:hypothetical protein